MKQIIWLLDHKVEFGFAILGLLAFLFSIGLFTGFLNSKPFYLKFYGGLLTALMGLFFYYITFVFDEAGSKKSGETNEIVKTIDTTTQTIDVTTTENLGLTKQVDTKTSNINELSKLTNDNISLLKKQNNKLVELNKEIDKNLSTIKLINDNQSKKLNIIDENITGGSAYLDIDILRENGQKNKLVYSIQNSFDIPIYDLQIFITDYSKSKLRDKKAGQFIPGNITFGFKLPSMNAKTSLNPSPPYELESGQTEITLEIRTTARNGSYIEWIKIIDIYSDTFVMAKQISFQGNNEKLYKIIFSEVNPNFPKDKNGEPLWYD